MNRSDAPDTFSPTQRIIIAALLMVVVILSLQMLWLMWKFDPQVPPYSAGPAISDR